MAESVRYCRTEDGSSIAFTCLGEGPPFVWIPSSLQGGGLIDWPSPGAPDVLAQRWARHFTVVRYDGRGLGHSAASRLNLSFDARVRDLDAVLGATSPTPAILRAMNDACAVAIAYTVAHPERVRAMVLFGAFGS